MMASITQYSSDRGELSGNILVPREAIDRQESKLLEAAQDYLNAHMEDIPDLKTFPNLEDAGTVTRYLVDSSLNSSSSMVYVERNEDALFALIAELHELDERINTFDDVIKNLEADFQKFPILRDSIEYHSPDEYVSGNEPLLQCYTNLASSFVSTIDIARDKLITMETLQRARNSNVLTMPEQKPRCNVRNNRDPSVHASLLVYLQQP